MTMPAGTYYIGDLCYVMSSEWDEFCDITISDHACADGEFTLKDGRRFATYSTMYGDGTFHSNIGTYHSVDAGLIGCILVDDIGDSSKMESLGAIVTFDYPFETSESDGIIRFGHVEINTGDYTDDFEYDEGEYE